MPVFTTEEYESRRERPSFEEAYDRLPVIARWDGLRVRWIGPLIDLGYEEWADELGTAAWGVLEDCGWMQRFDECGPLLSPCGKVRRTWTKAFGQAARRLAEEGAYSGFEGDPERVASWLGANLAACADYLQARAAARDALR